MPTRTLDQQPQGLAGLRIVSFESRRAEDLVRLIRRNGGEIMYAPALRQIPLADERGIVEFGERWAKGECDALVLLTGVGTTILIDALCTRWPRSTVLERFRQTPLLCRGPKPALVLQALGIQPTLVAASPHGERELLAALDRGFDVAGKRVFVQEYGTLNLELATGLRARGAQVSAVKVYRWALPENTRDLRLAIESIARLRVDAVIFTSAHQVDNAFEYAELLGLSGPLRDALQRAVVVASIGPVTSDALARHGVQADLSPDQPKLGAVVHALVQDAVKLQLRKRRRHP
jgi:uroporphyrinogen-III synthase